MAFVEESFFCPRCDAHRLFRAEAPNHVLHLLLTLFLCGAWLPVWILLGLMHGRSWQCTFCGGTPAPRTGSQRTYGLLVVLIFGTLTLLGGLGWLLYFALRK